jgi:hypothetical protein
MGDEDDALFASLGVFPNNVDPGSMSNQGSLWNVDIWGFCVILTSVANTSSHQNDSFLVLVKETNVALIVCVAVQLFARRFAVQVITDSLSHAQASASCGVPNFQQRFPLYNIEYCYLDI